MAEKKKNRKAPLIVGICVVAALVVVLVAVQHFSKAYNDSESQSETLIDVTADEITGFTIVNNTSSGSSSNGADSDATVEAGESAPESLSDEELNSLMGTDNMIGFIRENGQWECVTASGIDVDQTAVGTTVSSLTGVSVQQTITGVTDLKQYGLTNPAYEVTIQYKDNGTGSSETSSTESTASSDEAGTDAQTDKSVTIEIGNTNNTASTVYCILDGDTSTVYAVSTGITANLSKTISDYETESSTSSAS